MTTAAEKIGALVQAYHRQNRFDGVVLAAKDGMAVYRGAVGWADRMRRLPHALEAPFPICSVTKQFTSLLVMQQVAAGRLQLDSTLSEYLPDFPRETGARVTLRQMLMHTSGLPNTDDFPGFYTDPDPRLTDPEYVTRTYATKPLNSAPGATFRYNNTDYLVLAAILQKTLKQPYRRILHERILQPLEMTVSGLVDSRHAPPPVVGYETKGMNTVAVSPRFRLANYGASGAMYSTVGDLLKWDKALQEDRLLPRAARDIMFTSDPSKGYVALGTWVYAYLKFGNRTPTLTERQGGIGAFHVQNLQVLDDGISVILLTNQSSADVAAYRGKGIACDILRVLYEG